MHKPSPESECALIPYVAGGTLVAIMPPLRNAQARLVNLRRNLSRLMIDLKPCAWAGSLSAAVVFLKADGTTCARTTSSFQRGGGHLYLGRTSRLGLRRFG